MDYFNFSFFSSGQHAGPYQPPSYEHSPYMNIGQVPYASDYSGPPPIPPRHPTSSQVGVHNGAMEVLISYTNSIYITYIWHTLTMYATQFLFKSCLSMTFSIVSLCIKRACLLLAFLGWWIPACLIMKMLYYTSHKVTVAQKTSWLAYLSGICFIL